MGKADVVNNLYVKANQLRSTGMLPEAIEQFSIALKKDKKHKQSLNGRGSCYLRLKHYEEAIADFSAAIALDPNYVIAYNNRGMAFLSANKIEAAIEDCTAAINLDEKVAQAYINRASCYQRLNNLERAIEDYDKALEHEPKNANVYHNRAVMLRKAGKIEESIRDSTQAIQLQPRMPKSFNNRGLCWWHKRDYEKCIEDLGQAVKFDPNDLDAYVYRGRAHLEMGDHFKAVGMFSKAISISGADARLFVWRSCAFLGRQLVNEGLRDAGMAISISPDMPHAYNQRGLCMIEKKEFDKAEIDFSQAVVLNENYSEALLGRAIANKLQGKSRAFKRDLKAALKLDKTLVDSILYEKYLVKKSSCSCFSFGVKSAETRPRKPSHSDDINTEVVTVKPDAKSNKKK